MCDPMHFDRRADVYSTSRPSYPADLWKRVRATGLVGTGRRALDLGAGTGEATGVLLADGMDVVAVEPGPELGKKLSAAYPEARLISATAEDIEIPSASFDLVVAATSIHWMDLDVVLPKVRRALTSDGLFLVWRNVFGDPAASTTPFRLEVERIVARRSTARVGDPEDAAVTAGKLSRSGLFSVDGTYTYRWDIDLDAHQIEGLFTTFSDWTPAEVALVVDAARSLGGHVVEHYTSWLIVASAVRGSESS